MKSYPKASEYGIHGAVIAADSYRRYYPEPTAVASPESNIRKSVFSYASIGFVAFGTGSSLVVDKEYEGLWSHPIKSRVAFWGDGIHIYTIEENAHQVDLRPISEHFANIRAVLSPSVSDLAKVFGVTRQAVYKWISGSAEPEPNNAIKIKRLSEIADMVNSSGVKNKDYLLTIKAFDGMSVLDLLSNNGSVEDSQIEALLKEAKIMENTSSAISGKGNPTNDWLSSESIPGSAE
ncbi:helix-turn-helix domain-containing protein [Aeromonas veronii]|uniref:helix-turn-helix domain-containing protein n=1 Tax=Aeromonas veronii TaxID=654 RepID=UPI001F1ABE15|nr:helix-turn-helix transcriptional regulator [Aeromonas veronii]MCF5855609.1 helix-turn-helix domain-containing protein [Aeromonas veronii]